MQPNEMKEVDFYKYCKTCQYKNAQEHEEPCAECLTHPVNQWSHKPLKYKERKKEFSRYQNEHTNRDCNPTVQKEHPEKDVEFKCEECASSYKDTTSAEVDIMYCCESMVDGKCECDSGCVSDVRTCPGFKPKEGRDEERAVSVCSDPQATGNG